MGRVIQRAPQCHRWTLTELVEEHVMREASAISNAPLKDEERSNLRMFPPPPLISPRSTSLTSLQNIVAPPSFFVFESTHALTTLAIAVPKYFLLPLSPTLLPFAIPPFPLLLLISYFRTNLSMVVTEICSPTYKKFVSY